MFRLTNVIPEWIIFVSRGTTVLTYIKVKEMMMSLYTPWGHKGELNVLLHSLLKPLC